MSKPGPKPLDRVLLHEYLWEHRGRKNVVPFNQREIASQFHLADETVNRIFRELVKDGRLKKMKKLGKYQVIDPGFC